MPRFLATLLLVLVTTAAQAQTPSSEKPQQPSSVDFARDQKIVNLYQSYLGVIKSDDYVYQAMVRLYGERKDPLVRKVFSDYQRAIFELPGLNDFIYSELRRNYRDDLSVNDIIAYGSVKLSETLPSGLMRSEPQDWFELNRLLIKGATKVKDDSCKRFLGIKSNEPIDSKDVGNIEAGLVRLLSDDDLKRYFSIYQRAAIAERNKQTPKLILDPEKAKKALAYGQELAGDPALRPVLEIEPNVMTNQQACNRLVALASLMIPPKMPADLAAHFQLDLYQKLSFKAK